MHQLKKAHAFQARRAEIAARYDAGLRGLPVITPPTGPEGDTHAWHLYVLRLADGRELKVADTRKGAQPGQIVHVLADAAALAGVIREAGYTLIATKLYFNKDGRLKAEVALAKGKKAHDKRGHCC